MKKLTRTILLLFVLGIGSAALTGCNTTRGLGEDLENAGEEIQEETN